jgi:hypothetical protein
MKLMIRTSPTAMANFCKFVLCVSTLSVSLILQGCGGNGAGANAGSSTAKVTTTAGIADQITPLAKAIDVLSSQPSLPSDGRTTSIITVVVKDAGNRALENAIVNISTTDGQSLLQVASSKTGADGTVKATLTSSGKSNRTIPILAEVATLSKTINIPVIGTAVVVNGPSAVANGGSGVYNISVRDSSGVAIPDAPISIVSNAGNSVTPSTVTTDANGQAKVTLNISKATAETLTVKAAGATGALSIAVAPASLAFTNITALEEIDVAGSKSVDVSLIDPSGVAGKTLLISSTRGSITPANGSITTGIGGLASFTIRSPTAGIATISVTGPSQTTVTSQVEFVSKTPSLILLQPSKSLLPSNPLDSSVNTSALTANVRDPAGNPVKGVRVDFRADLDPSSGKIAPGFAFTDSAGNAVVTFTSGPNSTGSNGVKLSAFVQAIPTIISSTNMTVTNGEISVRIGSSNKLEEDIPLRYLHPWTALVVDSSGNPVKDAQISVQVVPLEYQKGFWYKPDPLVDDWSTIVTATCVSEDGAQPSAPLDGVLQPIEDINGNNKLDPGGVATVQFIGDISKTKSDGFADFYIKWAKSYSYFTKIRIDVKAQVKGSEATVSEIYTLFPLAKDINGSPSPPAIYSGTQWRGPYGVANACNLPN